MNEEPAGKATGADRMIDLNALDGPVDPCALLARQVQLHVDDLLPALPGEGDADRERFLEFLMAFSLSAEALHAVARGEFDTCADHLAAAQRHLDNADRAAELWHRSIWD